MRLHEAVRGYIIGSLLQGFMKPLGALLQGFAKLLGALL